MRSPGPENAIHIQIRDDCVYSELTHSFNAPVCLRYGDRAFPDALWTDFPVAMLCMWTAQLRRILGPYPSGAQVQLFFLDGDFSLQCAAEGTGLTIGLFAGAVEQDRIHVPAEQFLQAMLNAIRQIDFICERHQYGQPHEYDTLQEQKQWLHRCLKRLRTNGCTTEEIALLRQKFEEENHRYTYTYK